MPSPAWHLDQNSARLNVDAWEAVSDIYCPAEGLHNWRLNGLPLQVPVSLLGVEIDAVTIEDVYVRGTDLVVTYAATPNRPTRVQVYWRAYSTSASAGGKALTVDLQVSVQTHLLDSNPALSASSTCRADEIRQLMNPTEESSFRNLISGASAGMPRDVSGEGHRACVLMRQANSEISYAEMVHPADRRRDTLAALPLVEQSSVAVRQLKLSHELFLPPLEKGVILRGRIRGILLPRNDDESAVLASYAELVSAEPPLTT